MHTPSVRLYTRHGCHLCDDARQALAEAGLAIEEIDIDEQPQYRAEFDVWVPVVEIDGVVRFRGRVDRLLLRRLLAGHRP